MKGSIRRNLFRLENGQPVQHHDWVAVEEPLEIRLGADSFATTMRTPGDDHRLALGFLFSEGVIRSVDDVETIRHCGVLGEAGYGNVLEVSPVAGASSKWDARAGRRGTLVTSACGVCGRQSIEDLLARCGALRDGPPISSSVLAHCTSTLASTQTHFARTGGLHAAMVLDRAGQPLAGFEDVGRHNAVDKVVGELLLQRRLPSPGTTEAALLVVSGRASFEIVQKAAVAGIPVVASISAPSSLAIDVAQKAHIALASFVREGRFNLHTHPERVTEFARST